MARMVTTKAQLIQAEQDFDQRNEGVDQKWLVARETELSDFTRRWVKPNDIPIILNRAGAREEAYKALQSVLEEWMERAKDPHRLLVIFGAILELGLLLQGLAEARCNADVERMAAKL